MNPDFEKYDFSLGEVDWHKRDRKKCLKSSLYMFVMLEAIIWMIALEA